MVELDCPICGKPVRVSQARPDTLLTCKKCHTTFHRNKSGATVVGAPPIPDDELEELKQKVQQKLRQLPVGRIVAGLAAFLVVGFFLYSWFGPAESLKGAAEVAGRAFAEDDVATLRSLAAPGTAEDVARWFNESRPRLVKERERWFGDEVVEVHVAEEDTERGKGAVGISIHPGSAGGRDVSLSDPAAATASAAAPFQLDTAWTLGGWGRWKLDGRETYARIHRTP